MPKIFFAEKHQKTKNRGIYRLMYPERNNENQHIYIRFANTDDKNRIEQYDTEGGTAMKKHVPFYAPSTQGRQNRKDRFTLSSILNLEEKEEKD